VRVSRSSPAVTTLFAILTACSGGGASSGSVAPLPPASGASVLNAGSRNGNLFVSDFYASTIVVYPAHAPNPAPVGKITDAVSNPYNLAVDRSGTLYVQNNNNTVTEYPKGRTNPSKTLQEPPAGPGGLGTGICVIVGNDGTVYAADHYGSQVYEFAGGSTTPTTTLDVNEAFGLALDRRNALYVGWSASSSSLGRVMKFKSGSTTGHDLGITVQSNGGLAVDAHDNLLVGDQGAQTIDIFKRGATKPFRTIDTAPNYPYQFTLDRANRHLYLVSGTPAEVYVYDYATGTLAWTVTQGLPGSSGYAMGVAVRPEARQ